jgi:hypothetical protein
LKRVGHRNERGGTGQGAAALYPCIELRRDSGALGCIGLAQAKPRPRDTRCCANGFCEFCIHVLT